MRTLRVAAATLVAALALTACDGGGDPSNPRSTTTPSSTTEGSRTTPPSAAPTEPALPPAATRATEAGARAFISYYWELINYAQVTGEVKALKAVSGPNCEGCNGGIKAIRKLYDSGGSASGGAYTVTVSTIHEASAEGESLYGMEAKYEVTNAEQIITDSEGATESSAPATTAFLSYLIWTNDAWRTDVLEAQ